MSTQNWSWYLVTIDLDEYLIPPVETILGILNWMIEQNG
jgi:hypothetical protein